MNSEPAVSVTAQTQFNACKYNLFSVFFPTMETLRSILLAEAPAEMCNEPLPFLTFGCLEGKPLAPYALGLPDGNGGYSALFGIDERTYMSTILVRYSQSHAPVVFPQPLKVVDSGDSLRLSFFPK